MRAKSDILGGAIHFRITKNQEKTMNEILDRYPGMTKSTLARIIFKKGLKELQNSMDTLMVFENE